MPKATNISALEAKEIKYLPNNTVLISINEEHDVLYDLQLDRNSSKILTVRFSDVTAQHIIPNGTEFNVISRETAKNILEFIDIHNGKDCFINCAAGVSRSAAIAMFLHVCYGYKLKKDYWLTSEPNPFVLGRLISEYKKPHLYKKSDIIGGISL